MAKIKQKINISEEEGAQIRRVWDEKTNRWQYSITDIMAVLTESVDARNYWKVLKNRLKNSQNQLVMDCNQLKMKATDGKLYLVDTATSETLLRIIQLIAPYNMTTFKSWFEHIEVKSSHANHSFSISKELGHLPEDQMSNPNETEISTGIKIFLDIFEQEDKIIVKVLIPGFDPEVLFVSTTIDTLTIKGILRAPNHTLQEDLILQELRWGEFSRQISLPTLIDVENIEAVETHGLITLILTKIDQTKTRFIKIRSV